MQSVKSRIWTRVAVFISYDDNNYTTGTLYSLYHHPFAVYQNSFTEGKNLFTISLFVFLVDNLFLFLSACDKFPDFFVWAFKIVVDSWNFSMLLLYILWDDRRYFDDFRFKWTATAGIGIHSTKAWLSQLVNFKNAIWTWGHFRRTICNTILF